MTTTTIIIIIIIIIIIYLSGRNFLTVTSIL
jgi:hypothetical protein